MRTRSLFALPALAGLAALATRLVPGPLRDGTTLLPSGWRIRPAGKSVPVGTLPLGVVTLSDGSAMVTYNGHGENGLVRIDAVRARVVWRAPLPAAWLGLARAGRDWRDTVWASGGSTNRLYRFTWQGGATWTADSAVLADSRAKVFLGGVVPLPRLRWVAVVGNLSDSVYFVDAASLERRAALAVGHRPYTAVADSAHLYVSNWGDSTVSVIDLSDRPAVRQSLFVGPHPSALALSGSALFAALAGANGVARVDLTTGEVREQLTVALAPHAPAQLTHRPAWMGGGRRPRPIIAPARPSSPPSRPVPVSAAGRGAAPRAHGSAPTIRRWKVRCACRSCCAGRDACRRAS